MEQKTYLGKIQLGLIIFIILAVPPLLYFGGVAGGSFSTLNTRSILLGYLQCFGYSLILVAVVMLGWNRQLFGFNDDGIRFTFGKKVLSEIKWKEVNEIKVMEIRLQDWNNTKWNFSLQNKQSYLVFARNQVFEKYKSNIDQNFCIWNPRSKIYEAIIPHLAKIPSYEKDKQQLHAFFQKSTKGND